MTEPDNGPLFERAVRDPAARTTMHADALLPVEHTRDPDQMLTALMTAAAEAFGEFTPDALVVGRPTIVRHAAYLTVIHYWRRSINERQALSRENHQLRMDLLRRGFDEQDAALGAQLRPALARGVRAAAEAQGKFFDTMRANPAAAENFRRLAESKPGPERLKARLGACAVDPDATDQGVCDVHGGPWTPGTDHCSYAVWWLSGARAAGADL